MMFLDVAVASAPENSKLKLFPKSNTERSQFTVQLEKTRQTFRVTSFDFKTREVRVVQLHLRSNESVHVVPCSALADRKLLRFWKVLEEEEEEEKKALKYQNIEAMARGTRHTSGKPLKVMERKAIGPLFFAMSSELTAFEEALDTDDGKA